jgi:two-component system sensor kinase FixL
MRDKGNSESKENQELLILKHAVDNTNEAFVTIDENHKVLIFNEAAEKMFGYSRQEVMDRDLDIIMSPTCSRNHREAVRRYLESKVPGSLLHGTEIIASRKSGKTFPASISFSVTQVEGKHFFTAIVRDMTETQALQERIVQSERLAALGQLVAEITHEIKNPLMMIGGFAQQLIRNGGDQEALKKMNIIADEVNRLERLLADLGEFYLPKSIDLGPVDVKELVYDVNALIKNDCEKKGIQAGINLDEKADLVAGDIGKLKQVLLNLVKNSIEAMESGGNLLIETRLVGKQVEISVSDNGCGISEGDKEKIFSPFFTTKRYGTGLGLCISKRIVDEHEGSSFSVETVEEKGTKVKVSLPHYQQGTEVNS